MEVDQSSPTCGHPNLTAPRRLMTQSGHRPRDFIVTHVASEQIEQTAEASGKGDEILSGTRTK